MDVNGTRFHLLLGRRDWQPLIERSWTEAERWGPFADDQPEAFHAAPPLVWDEAGGEVALIRRIPRLDPRVGPPLALTARRGVAADRYGNLFWIGEDERHVRVQPRATAAAGRFWGVEELVEPVAPPSLETKPLFLPAEPPAPSSLPHLRGLTVTATHYLLVGTRDPGGLLIFDLHGTGRPFWWRWPETLEFAPFDFAATPDGGAVLLDRNEATGRARYWRLDRHFRPVEGGADVTLSAASRSDFAPPGAEPVVRPAVTFPSGVALSAVPPVEVGAAIGLVVLPDGSVLVLDAGGNGDAVRLHRYRRGHLQQTLVLDAAGTAPHLNEPLLGGHALAAWFDPAAPVGTAHGRLHLVTRTSGQAFAFALDADPDRLRLELLPLALPLQGYTGKGLAVVGQEVLYDQGDRWVALAEQPRYRYLSSATTEVTFDGKEPGCVWHRLLLDACIPAGSEVLIESHAADEPAALEIGELRPEPVLYRRRDGSEQPFDRPFGEPTASGAAGTWETLLQQAVGRYLRLRLTLRGDGRTSPRIRALRVYYPRFSYLMEYLPAVYREDGASAGFLERYLANVEGMFTALEGRIERAEALFDPAVAPSEVLPWLGTWLGRMTLGEWEPARRRLFLRYAWLLYRWRGTPAGLLAFLRLATEACPDDSIVAELQDDGGCRAPARGMTLRLVELFQLRRFPPAAIGDPTAATAPALLAEAPRWQASEGPEGLHRRFRDFVLARYRRPSDEGVGPALARLTEAWQPPTPYTTVAAIRFSPIEPAQEVKARDWRDFTNATFGFAYAIPRAGDAGRYREFLSRRYGTVAALNEAYGRTGAAAWSGFTAVPLPQEDDLPEAGPAFDDWLAFVSLDLPIARHAHRFLVLVPVALQEPPEARQRRLALVAAVVEQEKPAHTECEVRPFWALFQVGTARVGLDTVLGESGRFVAMVLDAGYLGRSYLAEGYPWNVTDRLILGRDHLQERDHGLS